MSEPDGRAARLAVIVAARNEADRIDETLTALLTAFGDAALWVADDASRDGTQERAMAAGAQVVSRGRPHGKGGNVTATAEAVLSAEPLPEVILICDGDLGVSARQLDALVEAVRRDECDLAVGAFSQRVGGGFGIALGFARWAIRRLCGFEARAPISGQRAMRLDVLRSTLPFAAGFGMEIGMTVDAVRAGYSIREYDLDLKHRATGRDLKGFLHRAAQLRDFLRVCFSRLAQRHRAPSSPSSAAR